MKKKNKPKKRVERRFEPAEDVEYEEEEEEDYEDEYESEEEEEYVNEAQGKNSIRMLLTIPTPMITTLKKKKTLVPKKVLLMYLNSSCPSWTTTGNT